jgi:hypothetical protein
MAAPARKPQPNNRTATKQQQGEVITMMPRLPKPLQLLMESASSKTTSEQLHSAMTSLHASLPNGSLSLLQSIIKRSGRGFAVPTWCAICDAKPPHWMHRTDLRRRWQSMHYLLHIKKGDTPQDFEVHHGDLRKV